MAVALIFAGASILSTIFIYFKQPVILAYIAWGALAGPWGFGLIKSAEKIEKISHFGVILLMFLLGLHLPPNKLWHLFKTSSIVTITTSAVFTLFSVAVLLLFKFPILDAAIAGSALMFSSTVISLKLCPTTTLHQQHQGDLMTSILLFQDIIAVVLILILTGSSGENGAVLASLLLIVKIVLFFTIALLCVKFILIRLFIKFDVIQEYIFLMSIGWCLLCAQLAHAVGLSHEIGAFIGGVSIANAPVAQFIAEELKPLREFFLILFFFAIGAQFDFFASKPVIIPSILIAVSLCLIKPYAFKFGLLKTKEPEKTANSVGLRLGQCSEFALLLSSAALTAGKIVQNTAYFIQLTTILTFVISTYVVVFKLHTPISATTTMRKD